MSRRAPVAVAFRAAGAAVAIGLVVAGCVSPTTNPFAFQCETVRRTPPGPDRSFHLQREIDALPAVPQNAGLRIELLERLAGLHKELDEYNLRREPALAELLATREREGRTNEPAYAQALYRLGVLQWARNRVDLAEATLLRCRDAAERALGHGSLEYAYCQHWLGVVYNEIGRYAEAERSLRDAAEIRNRLLGPEHPDSAYALFTLGAVYSSLGDYQRAEAIYLRTLEIREAALGPCGRVVADSLNNLGYIYRETGRAERAVPVYERALAIRTAWLGENDALVAQTMSNLGLALTDIGRHAEARAYLQRSLELRDRVLGPNHLRTIISVWNLMQNLRAEGRLADAGPLLQRGLRGAFASGDPKQVWRFFDAYRAYYQQQRQPDTAIFFGKQAINTIQGLRAQLTDLDRGLQRSFLENKTGIYRELADLLIETGRLPEAQQVLAMLKEEELFEFLRSGGAEDVRKTQASYTGEEAKWAGRFEEIRSRLAGIGSELEALEKKAQVGLSDVEKARRAELEKYREAGQQAFDRFLGDLMKELGSTVTAERNREIGQRNLADLQALQETLSVLGHGAVTLHYLVLGDRTHIILTTPQVQLVREARISSAELNRKIQSFRQVLQNPRRNALPLAQELYRILIAPVADDLKQANAQTLMVSLDGALRYLPFAALHDGKHFLVENHALAIYTEASKDRLRDKPTTAWRFSGLGLTRQIEGFSPLPAVREELEGVVKGGILPGEVYFDEQFNVEQFRATLDKRSPALHIASHFVFRPGTEADSFLLLGDGSRLSLADLKRFRFRDVDLITLSACETAVGGGKDDNGREIEGFGALAQRQGAKGVLATLWPVADQSTGQFMRNFYRGHDQEKTTKAEALRRAQLQFIRGTAQGPVTSEVARGVQRAVESDRSPSEPVHGYAHPFYWAPFILMGNWL